jgi:hypothetical protein
MKILLIALLILISSQAFALDASEWTLLGATAFDYGTTQYAQAKPGFHEVGIPTEFHWWGQGLLMAGSTGLVLWQTRNLLHLGHPKLAHIINYSIATIHCTAGGWDLHYYIKFKP